MIPGEIMPKAGDIELNAGAPVTTLLVANTGDRRVYGFNQHVMGDL